ncbi:MAG: hypothetical protein J0L82_00295 [Deltaproteobacteria bacterium]|nr:hypothetical protein [Deltaproteobacteria bacterium]
MNAGKVEKGIAKEMGASQVRGRIWMSFHAWTLAVMLLIGIGNVATALRPFKSSNPVESASRAPLITISSSSAGSTEEQRQPASSLIHSESLDYLVDVQLDCTASKTLIVAKDVRQLRLRIADCRSDNHALETFYIRNETNGFEATIFKIPDARKPASMDLISTDYISLETGENKIRISRSQGDSPSREQTLDVHRH